MLDLTGARSCVTSNPARIHRTESAPVLPEPSYAAQVMLVAASILDLRPTELLGPGVLDEAIRTGVRAITATLPRPIRRAVNEQLRDALPKAETDQTAGEYALCLRDTAKGL